MKNFIITLLLVVLATCFVACKKNGEAKPEEEDKDEPVALDMSKYFIKGTLSFPINGKPYQHPYIIVFETDGTARLYDWGALGYTNATYTVDNSVVTIKFDGNAVWMFTISNEAITNATGPQSNILNYALYSVPSSNQFAGNWYSGMMLSRENNSSMFFAYKFTATQFQETIHQAAASYNYTLIKNVMAIGTQDGVRRYFLALDGKLFVSHYNTNAVPLNFYFASLSKDEG